MDSIADLLQSKKPNEPPQLQALKDYVLANHNSDSQVAINHRGYSITVSSGALATTLRMELPRIQTECALDKKLFIRIGHF